MREAILRGGGKRVRPVMMTALTAIFGLLPAAFSTRIGAQTQRPLAIVVVGGMITTLFLTRYLMPVLYSFYGHREPPAGAGDMAQLGLRRAAHSGRPAPPGVRGAKAHLQRLGELAIDGVLDGPSAVGYREAAALDVSYHP